MVDITHRLPGLVAALAPAQPSRQLTAALAFSIGLVAVSHLRSLRLQHAPQGQWRVSRQQWSRGQHEEDGGGRAGRRQSTGGGGDGRDPRLTAAVAFSIGIAAARDPRLPGGRLGPCEANVNPPRQPATDSRDALVPDSVANDHSV